MVISKPLGFSCRLNELQVQELLVWMTASLSLWRHHVLYLIPHHSVSIRIFFHLCHGIWQRVSWAVFFHWRLWRALSDCRVCGLYGVVLCEYWLLCLCVGRQSVSEESQLTDSLSRQKKMKESQPSRSRLSREQCDFLPRETEKL